MRRAAALGTKGEVWPGSSSAASRLSTLPGILSMSTPLPGSGVAPTTTSGTLASGAGAARAAGAEAAQAVIPISKYALHFDPNARIVDAVLHPATTFQQANGAYVQELIG